MSKRFGRNQKRKAREEIALRTKQMLELMQEMNKLGARTRKAEWELMNAKSDAFQKFVDEQGLYQMAVDRCAAELGRALGGKLEQHADELVDILAGGKAFMRFAYQERPVPASIAMGKIVHVHIPLQDIHRDVIVSER